GVVRMDHAGRHERRAARFRRRSRGRAARGGRARARAARAARLDGRKMSEPARAAAPRRVFSALWPEPTVAGALAHPTRRAVRRSGGRPMAKDRLHVTVAFLGALESEELERARSAAPIATGAFELVLDRLGFFEHSRVLWLAPRVVPAALRTLEQQL